eukprot:15073057-Alexandrium_andersonii.AAC.1
MCIRDSLPRGGVVCLRPNIGVPADGTPRAVDAMEGFVGGHACFSEGKRGAPVRELDVFHAVGSKQIKRT